MKTTSRFLPNFTIPSEHHNKRKQCQNRKWIGTRKSKTFFSLCHHTFENLFLLPFLITLPLSPFSPQLQPRHYNIDNFRWHHIIVNIFPRNKLCQNHFIPKPSLLFSYQLPKIHFHNKKNLMKLDTFDFKSLSSFLLQLYPFHHLIISSHMLLDKIKNQKTVSVWRSSRWNKAKRNITHLNLS